MRIYMPEERKGPVGLYLHTHRGGWAGFEGLASCDTENSAYALGFGCAVAHVDFRVSWKAKFPAAVEDCFATYRWLLQNAEDLGVDKTRIGIGGGCTGANTTTARWDLRAEPEDQPADTPLAGVGAQDQRPDPPLHRAGRLVLPGVGLGALG